MGLILGSEEQDISEMTSWVLGCIIGCFWSHFVREATMYVWMAKMVSSAFRHNEF